MDEPEVKAKFGTLYVGLNGKDKSSIGYSFVFLIRRLLFVFLTFAIFGDTGIQIHLMIAMTLVYIAYLSYHNLHETP